MTAAGLPGVGLGELPALRTPDPFSIQTLHMLRVGWAAAELESAGRRWRAARELALEPDLWAADVANERGGRSHLLPDLVFWPAVDDKPPVAVVVADGPPKPRRELAALEAWKDSVAIGRYAQIRYVAGPAAAERLYRLAGDTGLTASQLTVHAHVIKHEPAATPEVSATGGDGVAPASMGGSPR